MRAEKGAAWLGDVNRCGGEKGKREIWIWEWDGSPVCNFGCSFVLSAFDAELDRLLRERDAAPYTGASDDYRRINEIFARIEAVGGINLFWT